VLDIDAAGVCTFQISHETFKWGRVCEGVLMNDLEELFRFFDEVSFFEFSGILFRLVRVDESVAHRSISRLQVSSGWAIPSRIDSRIPGIEVR